MGYESPIEQMFMEEYQRRAAPGVEVESQAWVKTICGNFRLDFVLTTPTAKRIAVECDGAEFHSPRRDEWRDAMILGAAAVDNIYRIRGRDITYHLNDALFVMSVWDGELFSLRGTHVLERSATEQAKRAVAARRPTGLARVIYADPPKYLDMMIERRVYPSKSAPFWTVLFDFAKRAQCTSLDMVIEEWERVYDGEGE